MGKRTKPKTIIVGTLKQAEGTLAEIAEIDRKVAAHEAHLNEIVDKAKADTKGLCDPLQQRRKALADALATFATMNRAELFAKKKSLFLGFGTIGFRQATKLLTLPKVTLNNVLERLRELGITEAIRIKENVDKTAMQDWPAERLTTVGMRRVSEDEFFIEIDQQRLDDEAA